MTVLPTAVHDYVLTFARARACKRILAIGADRAAVTPLADELNGADGNARISLIGDASEFLSQPEVDTRFDLALVVDALGPLSASAGQQLLGRLRDSTATTVLIVVGPCAQDSTRWQLSDFIALGFRRSPDSRNLAPGWSLYRYDIRDYKITPSWLNSRYWANPERW